MNGFHHQPCRYHQGYYPEEHPLTETKPSLSVAPHDVRLHRQAGVHDVLHSLSNHGCYVEESRPFHYKQPPMFIRMLYGIAVLTMLAGFGLIIFGMFVWLRNEAVFNGIVFMIAGIGTVWISAIPGSMYHNSVALQDMRQMLSHTGGRR